MSTDRDVTRIVRSWLEEGATALPDRVLDTVLDQLPATPQRRAWWPARRFEKMNNFAKVAIAAAAVVVVAVVGLNVLPRSGGGVGGPGPTPTPDGDAVYDGRAIAIAQSLASPNPRRPSRGGYVLDPAVCGSRGSVHGAG